MPGLLRSLWDEPRPPPPPPRVWRDWVLVTVLGPLAVLEGFLRPDLPWRVVSVAVTVALVPTLWWRRSRPLLMVAIVFTVTGLASLLVGASVPDLYTTAYVLVLGFSLFRWGSGREAVAGLAIMLIKVVVLLIPGHLSLADAFGGFAVLSTTAASGAALRYRSRAKLRELEQVKLLERESLARDLHDTVAHHVSAIAIRAQAGLATAATHPDAATDALRLIETEASRTLTEMRSMVRVLRRNEPAELAPNPRISDLHQLAGQARSGPSVDVEVLGDLDGLPASVGATIYRLAQESVTNAQRHAQHATRIQVRVDADDRVVHLRVSDDGETTSPATVTPGYGVIGMIERAGLLGGTCEAGPDPERGWTVSAVLPRTGWAT